MSWEPGTYILKYRSLWERRIWRASVLKKGRDIKFDLTQFYETIPFLKEFIKVDYITEPTKEWKLIKLKKNPYPDISDLPFSVWFVSVLIFNKLPVSENYNVAWAFKSFRLILTQLVRLEGVHNSRFVSKVTIHQSCCLSVSILGPQRWGLTRRRRSQDWQEPNF